MGKRLSKPRAYWFARGPFPGYVAFVPDEAAWHEALKDQSLEQVPYPASAGCCTTFKGKELHIIVTIRPDACKGKSRAQVAALIAHEAVHVKQEILADMQEKAPGVEVEAYIVQYYTQSILGAYDEARKVRAK